MKKILTLSDLSKKPSEGQIIKDVIITSSDIFKSFYFGGIVSISLEMGEYSFCKNKCLSPNHIFNLANLLLELFRDYSNEKEVISLNSLEGLNCKIVISNENNKHALAIGNNKDEFIFIDEFMDLLK